MINLAVWVLTLFNLVYAQRSALIDENNSNITKISTETFAGFITSRDLILAEFVIPKCPHSEMLLPDLEQVATELKPHGIDVIQINCEEDDYICSELKVSYFPTLRVFKNHRLAHSTNVENDKSVNGLVSYMLAQNECTVLEANSEDELDSILTHEDFQHEYVVVNNGIPELNETMSSLSSQMFNSHIFVNYGLNNTNSSLDYQVGLYLPFNVSESTNRSEPIVFEGNITKMIDDQAEFRNWLQYALLPPFADVKPDTFKSYIDSKLPLGYYFYWTNQELEELTPFFTELGEKYKSQVNFIGLDAKIYHGHVKFLNMREQFPLFGIHDMVHNRKYGISQMPAEEYKLITALPILNQTEVRELVEDFVEGVAEPIVKSEDIPVEQNSNVVKLVAKTHDDMVLNNEKDVIVRYYSPSEIRNKKGDEDFRKVADVFASDEDLHSKVIFADVNMQANDIISFPINSYPTIVLYPTGDDTFPINLSGPKSPTFILSALKSNGTHHADGSPLYFSKYPEEMEEIAEEEEEKAHSIASQVSQNGLNGTVNIDVNQTQEKSIIEDPQSQSVEENVHDEL